MAPTLTLADTYLAAADAIDIPLLEYLAIEPDEDRSFTQLIECSRDAVILKR